MNIKEIIEKAVKGRRAVILRCGQYAYIRYFERDLNTSLPVVGFVVGADGSVDLFEWTNEGRSTLNGLDSMYDVISLAPLDFGHWGVLRAEINYIAKGPGGDGWYGFHDKPDTGAWADSLRGRFWDLSGIDASIFPDCDWEDSVITRPGYEVLE